MDQEQTPRRTWEVFVAFLWQGLTAFGGPVAHLASFRREFVERRAWLTEAAYADLLALAHFLPGPASSQLGMAIGLRRAGWAGMLAAWIGFTAPAASAMIILAYAAPHLTAVLGGGWLYGLKIAAAAVVLQAVTIMARALAFGPIRAGLAIGAGIGLVVAQGPIATILALIAAGLFGAALLRPESAPEAPDDPEAPAPSVASGAALVAFALLLGLLPFLATLLQSPALSSASVFYRTGALVFGGGHVVLPLLQTEIIGRGWMDAESFVAAYGAAQALPGPLFAFAGFVGAAMAAGPGGWAGGLVAVLAIFLPSLLLVAGVLPFWDQLKSNPAARGVLAGVNAAVVGVLAAALWNPVLSSTVSRPGDWAMVAAAFVFLTVARLPAWMVVIGFAAAAALFPR